MYISLLVSFVIVVTCYDAIEVDIQVLGLNFYMYLKGR